MAQFNKNTHAYLEQAKSLFEVVMVADQYGNPVTSGNPSGTAVDAFGRMRISNPVTLFDSFNRYQMNGGFVTANSATGSTTYDENESTVSLIVDTTNNAYVKRETKRVFAYQPGKSLLVLNTFVFNAPKSGLRQRVGLFNDNNGVFLEQSNTTVSFVVRSSTTGSVSDANRAEQSTWNIDPLDGTGPSLKTLDLTKSQIFWTDVEWLGVGSLRCGFVIDGQFIHCHTFNHANVIDGTYMTTACLPVRYEIENTSTTAGISSTLKQICTSVISEGGYELRGRPRSIANTALTDLATAGTFYNLMSIRLKSDRLDAIVVPKNISVFGKGNNTRIHWRLVEGGTITGGTWTSVASDSAVEYNSTGTLSGGTTLTEGFIGIDAQSAQSASIDSGLFKFQLERNGLTSTPTVFTLAATGGAAGDDALGALIWEEIT